MRGKTREKKKKKKKKGENIETETQRSKRQPKHTLGAAVGRVLSAAGAALDGAVGRVLGSTLILEVGSIEIEEGRLTVSID